jgi:NitT/TauT family transport system ATP-binding protein
MTAVAHATAPASPVLIRSCKLTKVYKTRENVSMVALDNISFEIHDGEFVSIVGPSGCGKSTLMKIVGGLLDYSIGDVSVDGRRVTKPAADVGIVFQSPVLLPWRTIIENILLPSEIRGAITPQVRERAQGLLDMVGLGGFEKRYPYELSGGMQQRASIVRALVHNPKLLLMDEPFGALDAMTRDQMNEELLNIWSANRKTVVFITHSIAEAVFLSDRVFVMTPRPGRLAEIIDIDLPRPRSIDVVNSDKFGVYAARIRALLDAKKDIAG